MRNGKIDRARESQTENMTVRDIWAEIQTKGGKEVYRQTDRHRVREIHDPSLSNNGSSCGAQLSRRVAGIRNVECGISGLEVIATVCV